MFHQLKKDSTVFAKSINKNIGLMIHPPPPPPPPAPIYEGQAK